MKKSFTHKFKSSLMIGVLAGGIVSFSSTIAFGQVEAVIGGIGMTAGGTALSTVSPYAGMALGAVSLAATFCNPPRRIALWVNLDIPQTIAEYMVLQAMKDVTDKWKPEPQEEYQQAAKSNGGGCGGTSGGVSYDSLIQSLPFNVASLKNVGIEAIGVGPALSEIANEDTRKKILEELEWLQLKGETSSSTSSKDSDEIPGAGSCNAKYSVCSKYDEMTTKEREQVATRQMINEQNYGTAGITHAELGLKAVQQAMVNDGSNGKSEKDSGAKEINLVEGTTTKVQDLSGMIGTGANTVAAMKIVAMMNLELAQRLNQGNMLQGSILTVDAARAIPDVAGITD